MAKLGVNIDHVATIRQARGGVEPDPVAAAALAELAGADGITIHLREDRRHIQDRDLKLLRQTVKTKLNLEMAATAEMVAIALSVKPDMCTLVPEKRQELTTEGGLDVRIAMQGIAEAVERLQNGGIAVSLFVDPDPDQVKASSKVGSDYIEIHTGAFADAKDWKSEQDELERIGNAIKLGAKLGLGINAGHGLNYTNIRKVAALGGIEEYNIGHSIISRAVLVGLDRAVRDMVDLIKYA
ncbi:pyridoxal phosphate biosynthetic protein PdxJ [Geobacter metallireducens RCH3]|uniref:Pyridoxine 5'-phosphate synthase n=1 Tax=Geobacter metallireducens (strain ATCC 53774 / DSM 7210 / GS-15) TaxID=269799 RepID=PDXJ_GEOMG|nr:pyridoxine 5'-phosphate synthase [Geobacter metallireducens]Q39UG0.1 RecName: Full=Pyridoxine 5'-phosphate synthase; Short=PNP synthase [Geobacter metallireducens GS-15]ABB32114.1 pyridoxine-5'-phosphate synthase [Geobacter metallireducens GS-15]EHP88697.1 pyridoxal phosphate biosynthetic protein PdxJ [Geobacter metallireducens RCH3]MBT1074532.1 pyridoxine 5'-phosphate synthase [Geobacter grbiciae]